MQAPDRAVCVRQPASDGANRQQPTQWQEEAAAAVASALSNNARRQSRPETASQSDDRSAAHSIGSALPTDSYYAGGSGSEQAALLKHSRLRSEPQKANKPGLFTRLSDGILQLLGMKSRSS